MAGARGAAEEVPVPSRTNARSYRPAWRRLAVALTVVFSVAACSGGDAPKAPAGAEAPASGGAEVTPAAADSKPSAAPAAPAPTEAAASPAKPGAAAADTPAQTAKPEAPPPPEGWTRLELSTQVAEWSGTVDVPPGAAIEAGTQEDIDPDGLSAKTSNLQIGPRVCGADLVTMVKPPPRFASPEAMLAFHRNFEHVRTETFGEGHWAVVQQWRPGECKVHAWSAPAGLGCKVFKCPCDQIDQWVQLCGSVRPGDSPNISIVGPKAAFPDMDPAAGAVAMTVARAVARDDGAMLRSAVGPKGLEVNKKRYAPDAIEAAMKGKSVVDFVAPIMGARGEKGEGIFNWNDGGSKADSVTVFFTTGYGEQPYFELKKAGEVWHVDAFGVFDHGEP